MIINRIKIWNKVRVRNLLGGILLFGIGGTHTYADNRISFDVDSLGHITCLKVPSSTKISGGDIDFRRDEFAGPSLWLNGVALPCSRIMEADKGYMGENDTLSYKISYQADGARLAIHVTCRNLLKKELSDVQLSLRLGIDTEMSKYPHWRTVFFPTLMRCEKSHFWGYLMTPMGRVLTVACPNPVASYHLQYNNSKRKISFGNGHRIRTVSLDLLNPAPLPLRHPQSLSLAANESRSWTIYLEEVESMSEVAQTVSRNTKAPTFQADYYTLAPGESSQVTLFSPSVPRIDVTGPDGVRQKVKVVQSRKQQYTFSFRMPDAGTYTFTASNGKGQVSEMKLTCRQPQYSDYMKAARLASLKYQQKTNSNAESWYGLFSAMIAREYFPDSSIDNEVDKVFHQINKMTFDLDTHMPLNNPWRIQDTSLKAALWAQYYRATGNIEHLRWAADLADFIMTKQVPEAADAMLRGMSADGAYRAGKTHYTSVIYVAKGIMEVMKEERKLIKASEEWAARYKRHYASVKKAMDDLARNLDNIQTEGEMTFEDGMVSCSYTQLSEFALLQPEGSAERAYYTEAAEKLASMHRCLSQIIIPDSRMNGGSLRFWEAQYDILTMPNMMNSPHGWSAWRIYGLRNLYLLTGNYDYLRQMVNSIGSCIQLINTETAQLNWAFVGDPYIVAQRFVPDSTKPGKGKHVEQTIGEQYLPMISDWYRVDTTKFASSFGRFDGGSCDNDVHEIFKCLGEVLLTSAYVHEQPDGTVVTHNCSIDKTDANWVIKPAENCIDGVHVNLRSKRALEVTFSPSSEVQNIQNGWIRRN